MLLKLASAFRLQTKKEQAKAKYYDIYPFLLQRAINEEPENECEKRPKNGPNAD